MIDPFVLGVNYWPRRKAMYWWANFDADEVREEFAIIRELGMTVVRIFLLWDDWQKTPDTVDADCLKNLGTVCNIAAENGLGLDITFFTGHMSGPNWSPGWLLDHSEPLPAPKKLVSGGKEVNVWYRNYYTDEVAQQAQKLLVMTVMQEYHDHPGVWMWNLGNEPDLFAVAPTHEIGNRWLDEMLSLMRGIDHHHPITYGLHDASLLGKDAPRVDMTFSRADMSVMHAYPMYKSFIDSPLDPLYVPFTCALTTALCGKPTLMEEFGGCTAPQGESSQMWEWNSYGSDRDQFMASEADFADYIEKVLPNLVDAGAMGAVLWCYADYATELWDRPPLVESKHERHFGLVRPDGSLKPHAEVIKRFAATKPIVQPPKRPVELDITPDDYYASPSEHLIRLYERYRRG